MSSLPAKFEKFLSRLQRVTEHKPGLCWSALCPAHADDKPSMSINIGSTGNLVIACNSGGHHCTAPEIMKAVGLTMGDLFREDRSDFGKKKWFRPLPDLVYQYQYEDSSLAYEVCRYNLPDGKKDFAQRRPNPAWRPGGSEPRYLWNIHDTRLVPYRLPRLVSQWNLQPDRWTVLVEGEKCSDTLEYLDILATTHAHGSGHWRKEYAEFFRGRRVAIFYDCDPYYPKERKRPGPAWAVQAATDLYGVAACVRVCRPPGCLDDSKDDIADFVKANGHRENGVIKREIFEVIQKTADYYPGWERETGYHSIQTRNRRVLDLQEPGDMNEVIETVQRRLNAAIENVRLDSLSTDLAETAAWCQWLAELLKPSLKSVNIELGEKPSQKSDTESEDEELDQKPEESSDAQDSVDEEVAPQAHCIPPKAQAVPIPDESEPEPL